MKIITIFSILSFFMFINTISAQDLRKNGSVFGKIESNGDIRNNGSVVGSAQSVKKNMQQ